VVAGEIQATVFALGGAQTQAKAGKVKMIVLLGDKRLALIPRSRPCGGGRRSADPQLVWHVRRTGTPREIIERMNNRSQKRSATRLMFKRSSRPPASSFRPEVAGRPRSSLAF
jgi:hypothetical protein